jgi:hypothetical protein
MHSPTTTHWTATKRVLRYVKGSLSHGLSYTRSSVGPLHLQAFCDSDWSGNPDDRRSTSGFGVYLGNCLVSWSAKKQAVVSLSSTESEYRAMAITTAELYWLRMLFKELGVALPHAPVLWCDNVSALTLASNLVYHARTKHIEVDYHFVREKVVNGDIRIKFISTDDPIADIFTKGLSTARFNLLKSKLMVEPSPISLRGDVSVSVHSPLGQLSITVSQAKPGNDAITTQRGSEGKSKPGDTAMYVQANMVRRQHLINHALQHLQHPNNHAITDYDVSIYDCPAVSQTKKETQAHADCSPRSQLKDCAAAAPMQKRKIKGCHKSSICS